MSSVIYSVPNKVVHGPNSLEYLSELDGKKAVLVTGWSSMKRFGFLDKTKVGIAANIKDSKNTIVEF